MSKILIATKNQGKIEEFKSILEPQGFHILTMYDVAENIDIEETASTYEGNAFLKSDFIANLTGYPTIADDSGLEVDFLSGAPGVHSARYAGDHDDTANNKKLLSALKGVPDPSRTAKFVSCITCSLPNGQKHAVKGFCHGRITTMERGVNGFAYDVLFEVSGTSKTLAEMGSEERKMYSHRKQAIHNMLESEWFKKNVKLKK